MQPAVDARLSTDRVETLQNKQCGRNVPMFKCSNTAAAAAIGQNPFIFHQRHRLPGSALANKLRCGAKIGNRGAGDTNPIGK